jgi:Phytanoyl-CoA dioxygenase (PhyH)
MLKLLKKVAQKVQRKIQSIQSEATYAIHLMRYAKHLPSLNSRQRAIVEACRQEGVCLTSLDALGIPATETLLDAAEQYLALMKATLTDAPSQKLGSASNPALPQIFTVADFPSFTNWAQDPSLMNLIEHYVGVPIAFQGVHLRRDFANETQVTTELWHIDDEDRRIIKVFVYLTDVGAANGPFEYVPRDRVSRWKARRIQARAMAWRKTGKLGIDDIEMAKFVPRSEWKSCPCPAGSVLFADTAAIYHHGQSRQLPRSAIFFVYTAAQPLRPECCTQYHDETFAIPPQVASV